MCNQIWPKVNGLASEEQNRKNSRFHDNSLSVKAFDSVNARHLFCEHRISLVKTRLMNYDLILEAMLKIWPKVKVMTWSEKVMFYFSRFVSSAWTQLWCLHRSIWSLSKAVAEKNCWWPFMKWNSLGDMTKGHWSQYSYSGCQVYL